MGYGTRRRRRIEPDSSSRRDASMTRSCENRISGLAAAKLTKLARHLCHATATAAAVKLRRRIYTSVYSSAQLGLQTEGPHILKSIFGTVKIVVRVLIKAKYWWVHCSLFTICGDACPLSGFHTSMLRPASQAGPMHEAAGVGEVS